MLLGVSKLKIEIFETIDFHTVLVANFNVISCYDKIDCFVFLYQPNEAENATKLDKCPKNKNKNVPIGQSKL